MVDCEMVDFNLIIYHPSSHLGEFSFVDCETPIEMEQSVSHLGEKRDWENDERL